MKSINLLYDLLRDKTNDQEFYNSMMVRMVNPAARNIFKFIRDREEADLLEIRRQFLSLEARPQILKAFLKEK
ncbi:MAG: hypothetical protein ACOY4I_16540 [Bacillota bacterium]